MKSGYIVVLVIFFMAAVILFKMNDSEPDIIHDLPDRTSYVKDVNDWLNKKRQISKAAAVNKTAEKREMEKRLEERILSAAQSAVSEIKLWGKVVDQNGDPVEGVLVQYSADSGYLAEGSGIGRIFTGPDGLFLISNVKGVRLVIQDLDKPGYVYNSQKGVRFEPQSSSSTSPYWGDYSEEDPFMITLTKTPGFSNLIKGNKMLGFVPDGRFYGIQFLSSGGLKLLTADEKGDLKVSFSRDSDSWSVELQAPDGGLQETKDLYMISPPESGYDVSIKYAFGKKDKDTLKKNFYILIQGGKLHGHLTLEMIPYYRERSVIIFDYAVNFDEAGSTVSP